MGFSPEQKMRIAIELDICGDEEQISRLEGCLRQIEQKSEILVREVLRLLDKLNESSERLHEISVKESGLVKVDVIEFSPYRICELKKYRDDLKAKLAHIIGYSRPVKIFW